MCSGQREQLVQRLRNGDLCGVGRIERRTMAGAQGRKQLTLEGLLGSGRVPHPSPGSRGPGGGEHSFRSRPESLPLTPEDTAE